MARPRSLGGLLLRLGALCIRRRPGWFAAAACALLAVLVWPRHDLPVTHAGLQVAVLRDGFVLTDTSGDGRRVVELDAEARHRRTFTLPGTDDRRIIGTSAGITAGWQEGSKIRLAGVDDNRDLGTWGKAVRHLCEGVASNEARFGVGWLESDDSVWMVHGPLAAGAEAEPLLAAGAALDGAAVDGAELDGAALARTDWCGVASAEQNIALLFRSADRLAFTFCTKRRCSTLSASFALDRRLPLLGFGCLRNSCLIAVRDASGQARVAYLTQTGRSRWTKPLDATSQVSIVGVGERAFAVGYATRGGAEVLRFDRDGNTSPVWRDTTTSPPTITWSSGRLLVARYRGDALVADTIALAR